MCDQKVQSGTECCGSERKNPVKACNNGTLMQRWVTKIERIYLPYLWVIDEPLQAVNEVGAVEWVTSNSHNSGLAEALLGSLEDRLDTKKVCR